MKNADHFCFNKATHAGSSNPHSYIFSKWQKIMIMLSKEEGVLIIRSKEYALLRVACFKLVLWFHDWWSRSHFYKVRKASKETWPVLSYAFPFRFVLLQWWCNMIHGSMVRFLAKLIAWEWGHEIRSNENINDLLLPVCLMQCIIRGKSQRKSTSISNRSSGLSYCIGDIQTFTGTLE